MVPNFDLIFSIVSFYFNLNVTSFYLWERFALSHSHHYWLHLVINRKLTSHHRLCAEHHKGFSGWEVVPLLTARQSVNFVDSADNDSSDWHLFVEIEVSLVAELIQSRSDCAVMPDLNKATGLTNVNDVPKRQISLLNGNFSTKLENWVSEVSFVLLNLVSFLEFQSSGFRFDRSPRFLINNWLSRTELHLSIFVVVDNSGGKDHLLLQMLEDVSANLICDLTNFYEPECALSHLDRHSTAFDDTDIPRCN